MITFERRASVVLYKYLVSIKTEGIFLLPANICPIVPITFLKAGVMFEFVDISINTLCINEKLIIEKVTRNPDKVSGVLFNHTYGTKYSPKGFFSRLKVLNPFLKIIDDRCLCLPLLKELPGELDGIDLILYSTGYSKYTDIGFGGIGKLKDNVNGELTIGYNPQDLKELYITYKQSLKNKSWYNYHDSNWLDCRNPSLDFDEYSKQVNSLIIKVGEQKSKINNIYSANINHKIQYPSEFQDWRFNIRVPGKDELLKRIFNDKLFASSLYESLGDGVFSQSHFPVASKVNSETINLFNDLYFDEEKAFSVCNIIDKHLRSYQNI